MDKQNREIRNTKSIATLRQLYASQLICYRNYTCVFVFSSVRTPATTKITSTYEFESMPQRRLYDLRMNRKVCTAFRGLETNEYCAILFQSVTTDSSCIYTYVVPLHTTEEIQINNDETLQNLKINLETLYIILYVT